MQQAAENVAGSTSEKQAPRRVICDLRSTGKVSVSLPQIHAILHPGTTCAYLLQPPEPARRPVGIIRGRGTPRPSSEVVRRQYMPPCAPGAGHPPQHPTPAPRYPPGQGGIAQSITRKSHQHQKVQVVALPTCQGCVDLWEV